MMSKWLGIIFIGLLLAACADRGTLAPVVESHWRDFHSSATRYVVVKGDTLYSIAFRYDEDYRTLANYNHLRSPYTLFVGKVIHIKPTLQRVRVSTALRPSQPINQSPRVMYSYRNHRGRWLWPAQGRLVGPFIPDQGKKGIDIAGKKGDKIYASVGGVVAYSGHGLPGYGNLIIIKHDNQYLTAYAHNDRNLVREGQLVKAGQVIADMGVMDRRFYGVHFEIRQAGHPVNPMRYL